MDNKKEFKDIFKYLRLRSGLSQSQLAVKLGVSPALVGMYEQGRRYPSFEMEENIADFFNVSTSFLRGITTELNEDENNIVIEYRKLDDTSKARLTAYLKALKDVMNDKGTV
jgi:transcriptional regulator with XRE-family HTH domain